MKRQAFQRGEIRDENDAIISEGAYSKKTAFTNKTNDGILDYIINNFQALFDMISGACVYVDELPTSGDPAKLYVVKSTGKTYRWDGTQFILVSEAVSNVNVDLSGYAKKTDIPAVTVSGNTISFGGVTIGVD